MKIGKNIEIFQTLMNLLYLSISNDPDKDNKTTKILINLIHTYFGIDQLVEEVEKLITENSELKAVLMVNVEELKSK